LELLPHGSPLRTLLTIFRRYGHSAAPSRTGLSAALVLSFFLSACSSSVLIRRDDAVFNDAQQRLEHTVKIVDELKPPSSERNLFLQGESFYRYRFEPPPEGAAPYLAEAAAAITDFPAFQSLASSLELLDLRYRAYDSAIQLWETLLIRYPTTNLKSLTLYRLGWAYRNAGARGLPRESPDSAFDQLIKDDPNSPFTALAREAKSVSWKSKATATAYSLIPGLGQMYVGETRNGLIRLGVAVAALAAAIAPIYVAAHRSNNLTWNHDWPLLASGLGGLIVLSFDFTSSYEDAMRGVVRWNERAEDKFNRLHPEAP
jgi:tetratricopeptide (TPR) repeat protein